VYAPALPGFGGSADLPRAARSLPGYAAWVDAFMAAVGIDEPAFVLGHSFGGGVATRLAHDFPDRVAYLVLLNSVGAPAAGRFGAWSRLGAPALRPRELVQLVVPRRDALDIGLAMNDDLTHNLVFNPCSLVRVARLALTADLTDELAELGRRQLPTLVLWSARDELLPLDSFDAVCAAIGSDGHVVPGSHSWLLADPDAFAEVVANVLHVQVDEREARRATASAGEIAQLLEGTSLPAEAVGGLLADASPLWLMSESPSVLAADLALCHPALAPDEVRASGQELITGGYRLTVVAPDRPGLLADTAAVLAAEGVSVRSASAMTWPATGLALHALTFLAPTSFGPQHWQRIGQALQDAVLPGARVPFRARGRASVTSNGQDGGRAIVRVAAPDQIGLLHAICRWFADHGVAIESASVSTDVDRAGDTFVVVGPCDPDALAATLSARRPRWAARSSERRPRPTPVQH
jgi:pimeloyl-ACP methyl ester carboxylesterase/predicted amino acid-binding ACT domain protein